MSRHPLLAATAAFVVFALLSTVGLGSFASAEEKAPPKQKALKKAPPTKKKTDPAEPGKGEEPEEGKAASDPKEKEKEKATDAKAPSYDLVAWGTFKEVKDTGFWTLAYTKVEKGRPKKETVFVKLEEDPEIFQDKMLQIAELAEGDKLWILGKPVEQDAPSAEGFIGKDRQIKNVLAIATGESLRVNTGYKDPRDAQMQWLQAEVAKPGASLMVSYDGNLYKVVLVRGAPILKREKSADAKKLKSGVQVEVRATKTEERPETKNAADAKKACYTTKELVLLDPRLAKTLYPLLLE